MEHENPTQIPIHVIPCRLQIELDVGSLEFPLNATLRLDTTTTLC